MTEFDFTKYMPPGVYTRSVAGPQVPLGSSTPRAVGIFGLSRGYRNDTQTLTVYPDVEEGVGAESSPLRYDKADKSSIRVVNADNPDVTYSEDSDYEVVTEGSSVRLVRNTDGQIDPGTRLQVSYRYTPSDYFSPHSFYDYTDIEEFYGPAFDRDGKIVSELTAACRFALLNGADRIVTVAVETENADEPVAEDYLSALSRLREELSVAIIVPATGFQAIFPNVSVEVNKMSGEQKECRAILGLDGSKGASIGPSQRITAAESLGNNRIILVSPASFEYFSPEANKTVEIGGQFMAAALAGVSVSQSPAMPLTRKSVSGFVGIPETVREAQKNEESSSGLCVMEMSRRGRIFVRHGVTTNPDSLLYREWSVTGQQDAMVYRIRDYLNQDGIIGGILDDLTLVNVKASVDSALGSLVNERTIRDYQGLKVRQMETLPDVIEVSFAWQPSMPLNYIVVSYSVSVTSGTITSDDESAGRTSV